MGCYYLYKGKQYQELDDLYSVLLGEMEKEASVVKVENGKETTVKINTELFPDKKETVLKPRNLFTVKPIQAVDKKAVIKASIATQFIGFGEGISGSSTELYRQQAGKFANTGNYSSNDVIFVSIGGKRPTNNLELRKSQQDRTIKEAIKAIEAGATLITDNVNYIHYNSKTKQQRPITMSVEEFRKENGLYNEGEKRLYENLKSKGYNYSEQTIDGQTLGIWNKQSIRNVYKNSLKDEENSLSLPTEQDLGLNTDLSQDDFKC